MTDFDMRCGKENAREYVKTAITGNSVKKMLPMVICASLLTAMVIIGILGYIWTQNIAMIAISACAVALGIGAVFFLRHTINSTANKLLDAFGKLDGIVCSVSDREIIIVRDNRPTRVISWDSITEMSEGNTAFFLKEGEDGLMILGKDKVLSGTADETSRIIAQKLGEAK